MPLRVVSRETSVVLSDLADRRNLCPARWELSGWCARADGCPERARFECVAHHNALSPTGRLSLGRRSAIAGAPWTNERSDGLQVVWPRWWTPNPGGSWWPVRGDGRPRTKCSREAPWQLVRRCEPRRPVRWCGCRSPDASRRRLPLLTREVSVGHFVRLSRDTRRRDEPKMDLAGIPGPTLPPDHASRRSTAFTDVTVSAVGGGPEYHGRTDRCLRAVGGGGSSGNPKHDGMGGAAWFDLRFGPVLAETLRNDGASWAGGCANQMFHVKQTASPR